MTYETYRYIFMGGAALSAILFIASVFLFIFLHIPNVIGDLTGANERKAIKSIRNNNGELNEKFRQSGYGKRERASLTGRISSSGKLRHKEVDINSAVATAKIGNNDFITVPKKSSKQAETEVLSTEPLSANETTVLNTVENGEFKIEFEITYIHSDEMIM